MSYATVADMFKRYNRADLFQLATGKIDHDDAGEPLQTPDQIIDAALADASVMVDGYIDGRTKLPLKTVPAPLVRVTCVIARYNLEDGAATEKATKDYDDAIKFLTAVAHGDLSLGLSFDDERPEENEVVFLESAPLAWSRKNSKGFI